MRLEAGRNYAHFDLGMAALALVLQAMREGLYAHLIAGYKRSKVAKAAGLPEDFVPLNAHYRCKAGLSFAALIRWREQGGERENYLRSYADGLE
jgi:nitroreductase